MLKAENKKRNLEPPDETYDDIWLKVPDDDGNIIERKVDKVCTNIIVTGITGSEQLTYMIYYLGIPRSHRPTKSRFPICLVASCTCISSPVAMLKIGSLYIYSANLIVTLKLDDTPYSSHTN